MPVTGVTASPGDMTLYSNASPGTAKLTAAVAPANATETGVIWTSSNPSVAAVDADCSVTAVSNGTATVTATTKDGGFNGFLRRHRQEQRHRQGSAIPGPAPAPAQPLRKRFSKNPAHPCGQKPNSPARWTETATSR